MRLFPDKGDGKQLKGSTLAQHPPGPGFNPYHCRTHTGDAKCPSYSRLCVFSLHHIFYVYVPVWRPHEGIGRRTHGGRSKVSQFHLPWFCEEDISSLNVPTGEKEEHFEELTSPFLLCRRLEHAISTIRSFLNKHTSILFSAVTACCKGARIPGWSLEGLPGSAVFRGRGRARGKGSHARQGELPDGDPYKACSSAF